LQRAGDGWKTSDLSAGLTILSTERAYYSYVADQKVAVKTAVGRNGPVSLPTKSAACTGSSGNREKWGLVGHPANAPAVGYCPRGKKMTRKDSIDKMRELLVTRRNALRKALAGDLSLLMQLRDQTGGDVVDAALDAAQDEISSQLAEVESRELVNIERALKSIKSGTYGECEICNQRIPLARLNALPYATSCIECQRAAELSGGAGGGAGDWSRVLDTGMADADISFSDLET
jgi:DnaK suppressor protein